MPRLSIAAAIGAMLSCIALASPALAEIRYRPSQITCTWIDPTASLASEPKDESDRDDAYRHACCVKRQPGQPLTAYNADCPVGYIRLR